MFESVVAKEKHRRKRERERRVATKPQRCVSQTHHIITVPAILSLHDKGEEYAGRAQKDKDADIPAGVPPVIAQFIQSQTESVLELGLKIPL